MGVRKTGRQDNYFQYSEMYATMIGMQKMNVTEIPVLTRWFVADGKKGAPLPKPLAAQKGARIFLHRKPPVTY
jgi:hypothetical protein